jgi:hypothetical protein
MSSSNLKIYRPSTALVYLDSVISLAIVTGVLLPIVGLGSFLVKVDLYVFFFPALFGCLISSLAIGRVSWTIRSISVSDHAISGKRYLAVGRGGFPLREINIEKTKKRGVLQLLFGTQIIESKSGERIMFHRRVFTNDDVNEILSRCELI